MVVRESTPLLYYLLMGSACVLAISIVALGWYVNRQGTEIVGQDETEDPEVNYYEEEFPPQ